MGIFVKEIPLPVIISSAMDSEKIKGKWPKRERAEQKKEKRWEKADREKRETTR